LNPQSGGDVTPKIPLFSLKFNSLLLKTRRHEAGKEGTGRNNIVDLDHMGIVIGIDYTPLQALQKLFRLRTREYNFCV
jgi:hypothetical protein